MIPNGEPGKRRYGTWAGSPKGQPEDLNCCIEQVYSSHRFIPGQCSRKRGHGPNGEYCKQHAKHAATSAVQITEQVSPQPQLDKIHRRIII